MHTEKLFLVLHFLKRMPTPAIACSLEYINSFCLVKFVCVAQEATLKDLMFGRCVKMELMERARSQRTKASESFCDADETL